MEYAAEPLKQFLADTVPGDLGAHSWPITLLANYLLLTVGAYFFYLFFATLSYLYYFKWAGEKYYPLTLRKDIHEQIATELKIALTSFPFMSIPMVPFPSFVQMGYSRMYYNVSDYGWVYLVLSIPLFLLFTDCLIYWIHRGLHVGPIYKYIHKPHHTFRFTTPYSSHAFHPLDGWAQGVPYYIFVFVFPFHHILFVIMFVFVNFWTISIHDQVDFNGGGIINSCGHHTIHHADFVYNYGQYFTLWDRLGGTYKPAQKTHSLLTGKRLITMETAKYKLRDNTTSQHQLIEGAIMAGQEVSDAEIKKVQSKQKDKDD